MIFNKEAFFSGKSIKIIIKLMTALDKAVDLVEVQPVSNFEDIQFEKDEEFLTNISEDLIDIDDFEDDIENEKLSNKLLDKGFYFILSLSVHFLDYKDVFIFVRFEGMEKEVLVAMSITAIVVTFKTAVKQDVISPLVVTLELRLD